jgi:hypothetical protein
MKEAGPVLKVVVGMVEMKSNNQIARHNSRIGSSDRRPNSAFKRMSPFRY